jgi:uncharacterized protein YdaU (DUF1376 family)
MSRPWMPLYIADYLADTPHLDCAHSGAYLHLIMAYWQRGYLPDDDKKLASIARATPEQWASMRDTIAEFFTDGWKHKRIDGEIEKSRQAYERRALAGQKGGQSKASNATAMQEPGYSNALPTTITTTKERKKESSEGHKKLNGEFQEFWDAYGHKVDRPRAERALEKALEKAPISKILDGVKQYRSRLSDMKFIKDPAAWLNGERWADMPAIGGGYKPKDGQAPSGVYVRSDTPQGDAWDAHCRETSGKSQVWDKKGGWYFQSEWPPTCQ